MPRSPDPAIFVLTTDTTDHFTPCACARGNNDDDDDYITPCACARGKNALNDHFQLSLALCNYWGYGQVFHTKIITITTTMILCMHI